MKNTRKFLLAAGRQSPSSLRRPKHVKTSAISEVLSAELQFAGRYWFTPQANLSIQHSFNIHFVHVFYMPSTEEELEQLVHTKVLM